MPALGAPAVSFLLSQLGYHVPFFLAYLAAFVLALKFLERARTPAVLTLAGVGLSVLSTLVVTVTQAYLVQAMQDDVRNAEWLSRLLQTTGIAGSFIRAVGFSLLVAAVFTGRRTAGNPLEAVAGANAISPPLDRQ